MRGFTSSIRFNRVFFIISAAVLLLVGLYAGTAPKASAAATTPAQVQYYVKGLPKGSIILFTARPMAGSCGPAIDVNADGQRTCKSPKAIDVTGTFPLSVYANYKGHQQKYVAYQMCSGVTDIVGAGGAGGCGPIEGDNTYTLSDQPGDNFQHFVEVDYQLATTNS